MRVGIPLMIRFVSIGFVGEIVYAAEIHKFYTCTNVQKLKTGFENFKSHARLMPSICHNSK